MSVLQLPRNTFTAEAQREGLQKFYKELNGKQQETLGNFIHIGLLTKSIREVFRSYFLNI